MGESSSMVIVRDSMLNRVTQEMNGHRPWKVVGNSQRREKGVDEADGHLEHTLSQLSVLSRFLLINKVLRSGRNT
jgi:hypothetical protein